MRYVWTLGILWLSGTALVAQDQAPPKVDAYGREWDAAAYLMKDMEEHFGSKAWAQFAQRILMEESEIWQRTVGVVEIELRCSHDYRKTHPDSTGADYDAFSDSEEGSAVVEVCARRLLADPQIGPRLYDSAVAMLVIMSVAAELLPPMEQRPALGPDGEPPSEFRDAIRKLAAQRFEEAECLAAKVEPLVAHHDPGDRIFSFHFLLEYQKLAEAGVCAKQGAEVSTATSPAEGEVVDAFGRRLGTDAEMEAMLTDTLGSEAKMRFVKSILDVAPDTLKRAAGIARIDAACSEDYRKSHPEHSIVEYDAFRRRDEGNAWRRQCQRRVLTLPEAEPLRQAFLAIFELRMVVTNLITLLERTMKERGLGEIDYAQTLDPARKEGLARVVGAMQTQARCIYAYGSAKVGFETFLNQNPEAMNDILSEAVDHCPMPAY